MNALSNIVVSSWGKNITAQFEDRPDLELDGDISEFVNKINQDCENVTDCGFHENESFSISFIKRGTEVHRSYEIKDGFFVATH